MQLQESSTAISWSSNYEAGHSSPCSSSGLPYAYCESWCLQYTCVFFSFFATTTIATFKQTALLRDSRQLIRRRSATTRYNQLQFTAISASSSKAKLQQQPIDHATNIIRGNRQQQ